METWIVCGGGMRGIVAAWLLRRRGYDVTLVERAPHLGGVLYSSEWDGLFIDKGCHLLDLHHAHSRQFFGEILDRNLSAVTCKYASVSGDGNRSELAVPDLQHLPKQVRQDAIAEVQNVALQNPPSGKSLADALANRYGNIIGGQLVDCARKMIAQNPHDLDSLALASIGPLSRIRIGPDEEMLRLKQTSPSLDERLAASQAAVLASKGIDGNGPARNAYPAKRGMRGFCEAASTYLQGMGVKIRTETNLEALSADGKAITAQISINNATEKLTADRCYWSLPLVHLLPLTGVTDPCKDSSKAISMLIYAFRIAPEDAGDITYIHDYRSETRAFRSSTPGIYGMQQDRSGLTYVLCEVPCRMDEAIWREPEQFTQTIQREAVDIGVVSSFEAVRSVHVDRIPVAYTLPLKGAGDMNRKRLTALSRFSDRVVPGDSTAFGRAAITDAVAADLDAWLS